MKSGSRSFDEYGIRPRPNPRGSRPRTKIRPAHADSIPAQVIAVDRGRFTLLADADDKYPARALTAMRARELGRSPMVVGDRVQVVGDVSGGPDTLARIVRIDERATLLRRTADDTDPVERVLVANADQLVIVTALANPEPRPRMVDRCLVAAYDARMTPILCLTKADLVDPHDFQALYEPLGIQILHTYRDGDTIHGLGPVRDALRGHLSVLVGHSGVGKSTLVNALAPDTGRATGTVNVVTGRGRHTSSSALMVNLPGSGPGDREAGQVIDTPGVRSFGLAHVDPGHLIGAFPDLAHIAEDCPRGCNHNELHCELDVWAASDSADARGLARLESFRRLLASRLGEEYQGTEQNS